MFSPNFAPRGDAPAEALVRFLPWVSRELYTRIHLPDPFGLLAPTVKPLPTARVRGNRSTIGRNVLHECRRHRFCHVMLGPRSGHDARLGHFLRWVDPFQE